MPHAYAGFGRRWCPIAKCGSGLSRSLGKFGSCWALPPPPISGVIPALIDSPSPTIFYAGTPSQPSSSNTRCR
ncbi:hypothetical protein KSP40_PGU020452 [Platanthera guangdongensis]|uniref:Uncharacterized protein n=1 Tax=Platanthera guangdongensis TaxID=2320717 RepID=A0ABR2MZT2_9ASPA